MFSDGITAEGYSTILYHLKILKEADIIITICQKSISNLDQHLSLS